MAKDNGSDKVSRLEWVAAGVASLLFVTPLIALLVWGVLDENFWDYDERFPLEQVFLLASITSALLRVLGGMKLVPGSTYRSGYLEILGLLAIASTALSVLLILELDYGLIMVALLVTIAAIMTGWFGVLDWANIESQLGNLYLYATVGLMALGLVSFTISAFATKRWCKPCPSICDDLLWIGVGGLVCIIASLGVLFGRILYKKYWPWRTKEAAR